MYLSDPVDADVIIDDPPAWLVAGTGLKPGDALRGLLGYEVDAIYPDGPPDLHRLAHSPFVDSSSKQTNYADMTMYTAGSGALVFATGSMDWNWGLDGYNAPDWHSSRVDPRAGRLTRNLLDRMLATPTHEAPPTQRRDSLPSPVVVIAALIAIAAVSRAWIRRPRQRS